MRRGPKRIGHARIELQRTSRQRNYPDEEGTKVDHFLGELLGHMSEELPR